MTSIRFGILRITPATAVFLLAVLLGFLLASSDTSGASPTHFGDSAKWHDGFCISSEVCKTGDFDGDGRDDIIGFTRGSFPTGTNDFKAWVATSNGSVFGSPTIWHQSFCFGTMQCEVGDFNGDGKDDIVEFYHADLIGCDGAGCTGNTGSPGVYVSLSNGSTFGSAILWDSYFCEPDEVPTCVIGDVNGDGRDDIVEFKRTVSQVNTECNRDQAGHAGSSSTADVCVMLSTGTTFANGSRWHDYFCIGQEVCTTGDVDGNETDDLVAFVRNSQGNAEIGDVWTARSNFPTSSGFGTSTKWHSQFCIANEDCRTGDFNGDGRDDIIGFVKSTVGGDGAGDVYVALSNGSSGFINNAVWHPNFCVANETCGVGDVNGDGSADIVSWYLGQYGGSQIGDVYVSLAELPPPTDTPSLTTAGVTGTSTNTTTATTTVTATTPVTATTTTTATVTNTATPDTSTATTTVTATPDTETETPGTGTSTSTATVTVTPVATEKPGVDLTCDSDSDDDDLIAILVFLAGILNSGTQGQTCAPVGSVTLDQKLKGDIDCNGVVDELDMLWALFIKLELPIPLPSGCSVETT